MKQTRNPKNHYGPTIERCMEAQLTVLLQGNHGVGKTQMVLQEAQRQGLIVKYYSSATLDPWADVVGVPVPVDVQDPNDRTTHKQLQFIRPADIEAAELIFFDELNRSHPKVQNAVLEVIQFKSINGSPLPKLKMVWAAINPPDDIYAVTELDPVLVDRFHVHLEIQACPTVSYYRDKAGIPERLAYCLVKWWERDLNDDLRKMISPRRLEYMAKSHLAGIELRHSLAPSIKAPLRSLVNRLDGQSLFPFELTRKTLIDNQREIIQEMAGRSDAMLVVGERLLAWPDIMPRCVALFLELSSELQAKLLTNQKIKTVLVNLAREGQRRDVEFRALTDRLSRMGILK